MNQQQYKEYLQSAHWQITRRDALDRADWACQLCNSDSNLNVHHRTYERLKRERPSDLIVLCRDCHAKFHDKLAENKTPVHDYGAFDPWGDDENPEWHKDVLKSAAESGLARWVEFAWYTLMRKFGLSAVDAIESVSRDLNGGGYHRYIDEEMRQ